ncbi:hypothetical protein BGX26_010570, partial [Mortierella sp. AD094]
KQASPKGKDLRALTVLHDLGYTTDIKAVYCVELKEVSPSPYGSKRSVLAGVGDVYEEAVFTEEDYDECYDVHVLSDVWNGWNGEVN